MKIKNLIYISNTQIPSQKANTYQSILMADALANQGINITFLYRLKEKYNEHELKSKIQNNYNVNVKFRIIGIKALDYKIIKLISEKYWNYIRSITFAIFVLLFLIRSGINNQNVYTRDQFSCLLLLVYKILFNKKIRIIFEAHEKNKSIITFSKKLDGVVCIVNTLMKSYQRCRHTIVLEDACRKSDINFVNNYNITNNSTIKILYIGNLYRWKGVFTLLESAKYLPRGFEINIAGGSMELTSKFIDCIPKMIECNIVYHGYVLASKVQELIKYADCCIIPNENHYKNEYTSPMKAYEYLASAKIIISSDLPILKKIFMNNAIYFKAGDPKDLANAICSLKERTNINDMALGLRNIAKNNTWDFRAKKLINWLQKLK